MATIKPRRGNGYPASGLVENELAIDTTNKRIYLGSAGGSGITIASLLTDYVSSVNGSTGTITNVARTNEGNTFSVQQILTAGLSASATTNTLNITATSDGVGLVIAQDAGTGVANSRIGRIRLGRSATSTQNTLLENSTGKFSVYNGAIGNTNLFSVDSSGATISNTQGLLRINTENLGADVTGVIRFIVQDEFGNRANQDLLGNRQDSSPVTTTNTLPNTSGVLLNDTSPYVSGICGATGAITLSAGSNITITKSGNIFTFASTASGGGGFTYAASAPGTPSVGDRWIDSDTGKEFVYINDGNSSQWMEPVSSNGLVGLTYTAASKLYEFGGTGSFSGSVSTDSGYQITSSVINALTGTTYALLSTDNGKIITWNNNTQGVTLTVPSGLPVGFNTTIIQTGTGSVGITGSGVTLNSFEGKLRIVGQHGAVSIISYASNVFNVAGGLTG